MSISIMVHLDTDKDYQPSWYFGEVNGRNYVAVRFSDSTVYLNYAQAKALCEKLLIDLNEQISKERAKAQELLNTFAE